MARGEVSLTVNLAGQDQLSATVERAGQSIDRLGDRAKRAGRGATEGVDGASGGVGRLGDLLGGVSGKLLAVGAAATGAFVAVGKAIEMAESGIKSRNIAAIYEAQFTDAAGALESFRQATRNTVDDTTLQQLTTQMGMVGLSAQQSARILEGSFALSASSGKDMAEVISSVLGALRGEMDSLQEKGVAVDLDGTYDRLAASIGKTSKELSEAEKAAARQDAVLDALGKTASKIPVDRLETGFQRLGTRWDNFVSDVEVGIAGALEPLADGLVDILDASSDVEGAFTNLSPSTMRLMKDLAALGRQSEVTAWQMGDLEAIAAGISKAVERRAREQVKFDFAAQNGRNEEFRQNEQKAGWNAYFASEADKRLRELELQEAAAVKLSGSQRAQLDLAKAQAEVTRDLATGKLSEAEAEHKRALAVLRYEAAIAGGSEGSGGRGKREKQADPFASMKDHGAKVSDDFTAAAGALRDGLRAIEAEMKEGERRVALHFDVLREQRIASLDDNDRIGRLEVDHEFRLLDIQRTVKDEREALALEELENLRYAADRRGEIRAQELESFQSGIDSIMAAGQALAQYDSTGIGAGLVASVGQIAKSWDGLAKGSPAAISAVGNFAAGFIKNETARAAVSAIVETAAGFASLGYQDYWGAGMHFTSAAVFGMVSGLSAGRTSGKGAAPAGAGSRSVGSGARLGGGSSFASGGKGGQSQTVVINYGVLGMPDQQAVRSLSTIMGAGVGSGYETVSPGRI